MVSRVVPFFGFNRDGAEVSQGAIDDLWRQGMEASLVVAAEKAVKLVKDGTLKIHPGAPHGIFGADQDEPDGDILAFIRRSHGGLTGRCV